MHAQGKGGPWNLEGKAIRLESGACKFETKKKVNPAAKEEEWGKEMSKGRTIKLHGGAGNPRPKGTEATRPTQQRKWVTDSQNRERMQKMPTFLCTKHGA